MSKLGLAGQAHLTYHKPETRYRDDGTTVSEDEADNHTAPPDGVTPERLPQLYSASEVQTPFLFCFGMRLYRA